jgi:hypothetical protein
MLAQAMQPLVAYGGHFGVEPRLDWQVELLRLALVPPCDFFYPGWALQLEKILM